MTHFIDLVEKATAAVRHSNNLEAIKDSIRRLDDAFDALTANSPITFANKERLLVYLNMVRRCAALLDSNVETGSILQSCLTSLLNLQFCLLIVEKEAVL